MITPDSPTAAAPESETCVPASALAIEGTNPAIGDEVEFTGKGRVTKVDGDKVYFETIAVNGEPTHQAGADDMDADEMMRMAQEADQGMS